MILSDNELIRYNRQIVLKQIDLEGQEKLKSSRIVILGMGGLGCACAQYLTASGLGHLTLIDFDRISLSNLSRQILYNDSEINQFKVDIAQKKLTKINPFITISTKKERLSDHELLKEIKNHDLVIDCSDNLQTRNQLNKLCFSIKKPLISGAAIRTEGILSLFTFNENEPCYECFSHYFPQNELSCIENGVLSPFVGLMGTFQATESIKFLLKIGNNLSGKIMFIDILSLSFSKFILPKNTNCKICT